MISFFKCRWLFVFVAVFSCGKPKPPNEISLKGDTYSVRIVADPFLIQVVDASGQIKLQTAQGPAVTFVERTFEAQLVPGWDDLKTVERPWTTATQATIESFDEHAATLKLSAGNAVFHVKISTDKSRIRYEQKIDESRAFNAARVSFVIKDDSHFFGMGQRTGSIDHRGFKLYSWAEEGGLGAGENVKAGPNAPYPNGPSMTYFPVPFFHTSHGVSVLVDTTYRSEIDFGSPSATPGTFSIGVDTTSFALTLYVRDNPLDAIDDFTADTGRPPIPAPWAFGPRRRINRGSKIDGTDEWQLMRDRKLPLTGIDDAMHALPSVSQAGIEPELKMWTALLHANGFKVFDYNNPYVSLSAVNSKADYLFGNSQNFFEQMPNGMPATTFFLSGGAQQISAIDLTNPAAVTWFHSLLKRSLDLGYDGWMHDFGEYVARTSKFHDGRRGDEVHNAFSVLSAKAGFEFLQKEKPNDAFFFVRSGYTGSQQYIYEAWGGDPEASFDETQGLPSSLRGGLNLSMSGVPYWSSDIGGYKCLTDAPHDREMLWRWYEASALSPMMHDEDACSNPIGGEKKKATLWSDVETQIVYREMASLHTRLAPYFRTLALQSHEHGTPLTQHPFLRFPQSPHAWSVDDSFYLGQALYAAPVVRRGQLNRKLWLPPGTYVEWNSRNVFEGDANIEVPAPLNRLPLFLVAGHILPLLDNDVQTLAPSSVQTVVSEANRSQVLDVIVALKAGTSASLKLADGTVLSVARGTADVGNVESLSLATEITFKSCQKCQFVTANSNVNTIHMATLESTGVTMKFKDLEVSHSAPTSKRIRWEVIELN
jgi:sulfoquinovosidase